MTSLINSLPSWALFLLIFTAGLLAAEGGAWVMLRKERKGSKVQTTPPGSLIGALLGLLAFMLGFTFSLTASKLSDRKQLAIDHANAIGTCFLRTSFLPDSQKLVTKRLYHDYTTLLIGTSKSDNAAESIVKLEALQQKIWDVAASLKGVNMDPPLRALYVASVNELLDISGERKTVVFIFRIPGLIWAVLFLLYIFCMFVVGLEIRSFPIRKNIHVVIMAAAFAMIVVLISAMDGSDKPGQFTVSQQPLLDVQQMIKENLLQKEQ